MVIKKVWVTKSNDIGGNMTKEEFQNKYCSTEQNRKMMRDDFNVSVFSFKELLPGRYRTSYAYGNKKIHGACFVFIAEHRHSKQRFYPVFSESVGRTLLKQWGYSIPRKESILKETGEENGDGENTPNDGNKMIVDSNFLMLLDLSGELFSQHRYINVNDEGPFQNIRKEFMKDVNRMAKPSEIAAINTILGRYFNGTVNKNNEQYSCLSDYIDFLRQNPQINLKEFDFTLLRMKLTNWMKEKNKEKEIYF